MRILVRVLGLASFLGIAFAAFNNFAPIEVLTEKAKRDVKQLAGDLKAPEKEYVQINGKFYEKNARGVYYIDGVATFVKNGKPAPKPTAATVEGSKNLGPAIDPSIYKDAMGLSEDDEFFKPRTGEE